MFERSSASRSIPGVLFAEDFDDPAPAAPQRSGAPPEIAAPEQGRGACFTEEEMRDLTAIARDEGYSAGLEAARQSEGAERLVVLGRLADAIGQSRRLAAETAEVQASLIADAALSLLLGCVPAMSERLSEVQIRTSLRSILPALDEEQNLAVTVHPDLEAVTRAELHVLASRNQAVDVLTCRDYARSDIRVAWQNGSATRDIRSIQRSMAQKLVEAGFLSPDHTRDFNHDQ